MLVESLIASASGAGAATGVPAPASAAEVEQAGARFTELMQAPADDLPPLPVSPGAALPVSGARGSTLGDAILDRLTSMSEDLRIPKDAVHRLLNDVKGMDLGDMLGLQLAIQEYATNSDLYAKVIGKLTQTVDTLTKQQ